MYDNIKQLIGLGKNKLLEFILIPISFYLGFYVLNIKQATC